MVYVDFVPWALLLRLLLRYFCPKRVGDMRRGYSYVLIVEDFDRKELLHSRVYKKPD